MDVVTKFSIASQLEFRMKPHLFFRLHEHLEMIAEGTKPYEEPDLQINLLDYGHSLAFFYVIDFADVEEETVRKKHLNALLRDPQSLFGVITDGQAFHIYENDENDCLNFLGHHSLNQLCHYFNSFWIELGLYPPLEENDYSYTKSGGATDIIIDKLDAAYLFSSQTAVACGVAHPILLTYDMLTLLLGFQPNSNGDLELNGFVVNNISGKFFHKGKRLTYLSQLQQCYRREMRELAIDETLLPNYII